MSTRWKIAVLVDPLTALVSDNAHALGLAEHLAARGHSVRVFGPPPTVLGLVEEREKGPKRPAVGASVALFAPQAVVAYDALSPAAWLGARAARRHGAPLTLIEAAPWAEGRPAQRALWRVGEALWGRYVRRTAAAVLALEPQARERSLRRGFDASCVHSVAHGVDLEVHRPGRASEELARRQIRGRILSCRASYAASEALERLVMAFSSTVGQRDDWSLVVAGDGPPPARLAKCAYRAGVGARVHFLSLSDEAFAPLLSSSTLFAALGGDGVRAAWDVERALACGAPTLIASGTRGAHLVEHDLRGWVLEDPSAEGWAAALARAAASPQARKRWSHAARAFAEERLGWAGLARSLESVVEARLARRVEPSGAPEGQAARA
jgi:glycosyltransferase involved in cell wall biosynthesis